MSHVHTLEYDRVRKISNSCDGALCFLDLCTVVLSLYLLSIIVIGCAINVRDSESGSGYNDRAPCNAAWVAAHPNAASLIALIDHHQWEWVYGPAFMIYAISFGTAPAFLAAWQIARAMPGWKQRKRRWLIAPALLNVIAIYPMWQCMICILD